MRSEKKIMNVLLDNVGGEKMYLSQIAQTSGASISTCHQILEKKVADREIEKVKVGNLSVYFLDQNDPVVSQMKVVRTIELLRPLLTKLQKVSQKVILFGSAAQGKDSAESDFDLFILTNEKRQVQQMIKESKIGQKIQPVIKNFLELMELKKKDPVFYEEINNGKVLWEEQHE